MNFSEWLASSIGTGALLCVLTWIFRNWITTRLKNAIGHEYNLKLEKFKAELNSETEKQLLELKSKAEVEFEKYRVRIGPYSEKQFQRYNDLWIALAELRHVMEDLWLSATESDLIKFSEKLKKLHEELEKSALLVEEDHYQKLSRAVDAFMNYQIGKQTLIDLRQQVGNAYVKYASEEITRLISENEQQRRLLNSAMSELMDVMRSQINGTKIFMRISGS